MNCDTLQLCQGLQSMVLFVCIVHVLIMKYSAEILYTKGVMIINKYIKYLSILIIFLFMQLWIRIITVISYITHSVFIITCTVKTNFYQRQLYCAILINIRQLVLVDYFSRLSFVLPLEMPLHPYSKDRFAALANISCRRINDGLQYMYLPYEYSKLVNLQPLKTSTLQ